MRQNSIKKVDIKKKAIIISEHKTLRQVYEDCKDLFSLGYSNVLWMWEHSQRVLEEGEDYVIVEHKVRLKDGWRIEIEEDQRVDANISE